MNRASRSNDRPAGLARDASGGQRLWRSLDQLAGSEAFDEQLEREFPRHAASWDGRVDRRKFLGLAGASLGLAGLTACTKQPPEKVVPYVRQPEELVPGRPLFFATAMPFAGYGLGLLAESHMGRPTKLEGNPDHPASLGRTDVFAQASVLDLYDPDRSRTVTHLGKIRTWDAFLDEIAITMSALEALGGEGLRLVTGTVTSPTLGNLLEQLLEKMPAARWHQFEPASSDSGRRAMLSAFGRPLEQRFDLAKADVVVAIDSDFLTHGPGAVRYARDFARRRQVRDPAAASSMSRLYSIDTVPTATSSVADHRLALPPTEVWRFTAALAARLGVGGASMPAGFAEGRLGAWVEEVAADLEAHRGRSAIIAGDTADPEVHVLAHALNERLGNAGTTVLYSQPVEARPIDRAASFAELVADMEAGAVDTVLFLDVNPLYSAPADFDLPSALDKVRLRVHLGSHLDETSKYCQWHLPSAHYLESWGDVRAYDGTATILQPLIEPLYGAKTPIAVVAALSGRAIDSDLDLVREHWRERWQNGVAGDGEADFERFWRRSLHSGRVAGTELPPVETSVDGSAAATAARAIAERRAQGLELLFRPDPSVFDGRYANNSWLQECPRPLTKLTWDNALLISPSTAREMGLDLFESGDQRPKTPIVRLIVGERSIALPVWALPGHADGAMTLHLGYGREHGGRVADGAGFNAYQVRVSSAPWQVSAGVDVGVTGAHYRLASTQEHHSMEGRDLVRQADLASYLAHPQEAAEVEAHVDVDATLMDEDDWVYDTYAWGMSIDLTACTGCNACLVACQSENNIPPVGKEQVLVGREMHWIRIDRYFTGEADDVDEIVHQPVPCMHCEQAPCEVVCPVAATVHSDEGLNDMVYNRCVGTRYCSNNCPYKVRRFNFLLYQDWETPSLKLMRNPDVTVRSRGVMEKCSYCVQRINKARIDAKREHRRIADGEIVTACQQACPSDAIVFGDTSDPGAAVTIAKASPLDYSLLEELGTRPRTTYVARIRNRNPRLVARLGGTAGEADHGGGHHG